MTVHSDWVSAEGSFFQFVAPGGFAGSEGSTNDEPALLLNYDEVVVLEGTIDELRARLQQGLEELDGSAAREAMAKYEEDQQFRDRLLQAFGQLSAVRSRHEDADEACELVDGLLKRLWDEDGKPVDPDQ